MGQSAATLRFINWRTAGNSAAFALPALQRVFADAQLQRRKQSLMLDVGCGPGTITVGFAEKLASLNGSVIGLDYSADVLEGARMLAAERGLSDHLTFEQGDVFKLRWPDATFTAVHAHQVLMHLPDPVAALKEIKRVLKTSGAVLALREGDVSSTAPFPESDVMKDSKALWIRVGRAAHAEPDAGRRLKHWALATGFKAEQISFSADAVCFSTPDACATFGERQAEMMAGKNSSWAQSTMRDGHATQEQLQRIGDAWREWGRQPDATLIMPHGQLIICL